MLDIDDDACELASKIIKHRTEHTQKFGGDLVAICADLQVVQRSSGHEVVRLSPKKLASKGTSRRSVEDRA